MHFTYGKKMCRDLIASVQKQIAALGGMAAVADAVALQGFAEPQAELTEAPSYALIYW